MKKTILIITAAFALAAFSAQAAETYKWRMNQWVPETSALYTMFAPPLAKRIKQLTDGQVDITPYPVGVIAPAMKAFDPVIDGTVETVQSPSILLMGRDPTNVMFCVWPGGMGPDTYMHWMYQGGGAELLEEFHRETMGLHSIPAGLFGTELFAHSHKPIRTAEDLKGLKYRTMGAMADVMKNYFDAAPTVVPGSEVYTMLQRKAIDAAEWSGPAENLIAGLEETAKYIIYPGAQNYSGFMIFSMKQDRWDALSDDLKIKIEAAAKLSTFETMQAWDARDIEAWKKIKKGKNELIRLDDTLIEAFRVAGRDLAFKMAAEQKAKGNPWMERVVKHYYEFFDTWLENTEYRQVDTKRQ